MDETSSSTVPVPSGAVARAIGVMLPRDLPAADVLPFARRADALGFDELWVVEDLGFRGGIAQAATVLAATERIRVGIGILPVAARNVAFTAMELNTLAELFPGRVDAGIGHGMRGWMQQVGAWPNSPLTLLREQATALRHLLRGETVTVEGAYVQLTDIRLEHPASVVPPVLAGVRGPRSLALAGEFADGAILAEPVSPEYVRAALVQIGEHPGRRLAAYNVACVDDDPDRARRVVRPALQWIGEPDWAAHIEPLPFAKEFVALRAACVDRAEFAARLPDAWVDQLAVVGTPSGARRRIDELHQAGATSVVLSGAGPDSLEALARVL